MAHAATYVTVALPGVTTVGDEQATLLIVLMIVLMMTKDLRRKTCDEAGEDAMFVS